MDQQTGLDELKRRGDEARQRLRHEIDKARQIRAAIQSDLNSEEQPTARQLLRPGWRIGP